MTIQEILKKHQFFKQLSKEALTLLKKEAKVLKFKPGEVIISAGQRGKNFGIVIEGQLEARDMEGERLGVINKEEYVGEMSLLSSEPSTATVMSVSTSIVMLIPHLVMSRILPESQFMIKQLSATMRVRLLEIESSKKEKEALGAARGSLPGPGDLHATPGAAAKKILVINCRLSSLKWNFYDLAAAKFILEGKIERLSMEGTVHIIKTGPRGSVNIEKRLHKADHAAALDDIFKFLAGPRGPLSSLRELDAVGHRVMHGGEKYTSPVVIDKNVLAEIKKLSSLAPLHNSVNLKGIETAVKRLPGTPQVAVFDTAFHQTLPAYAYLYALPRQYYEEKGVRRYGFHGTSHYYVALEAAAFVKKPLDKLKIITCHLGDGASICAIDHGRSIDTSMGLTPVEGLVMGTRCGDVDPGVLVYLAREYGLDIDEIDRVLNKESGLLGLSGISGDMRGVMEAAALGSPEALTAIQVFCYRVKKYIGAYIAALDGLDLIVFTGGIGMAAAGIRARVCQGLNRLGVILDEARNRSIEMPEAVEDISDLSSSVKMLVVPTGEGKMIARETIRALRQKEVGEIISMSANKKKEIPLRVSYRHVHLDKATRDVLFGKGYKLQPDPRLSHTGQLVYKERVNLVGPKGTLEKVRIQGPMKTEETQVEIARTEEFLLGIDAPLRESGNLSGKVGQW